MNSDHLQVSAKAKSSYPILVVDDEENFLMAIRFVLGQLGYSEVLTCNDSRKALKDFKRVVPAAVLLDISMPFQSGLQLLEAIHEEFPQTPIIMITAVSEISTAVRCIKSGAFDYLLKPLEEDRLECTLKNALDLADCRRQTALLKDKMMSGELSKPEVFKEFVTESKTLLGIFSYIEAIAPSKQPALITGETGTGKELVARALHDASGRTGAFVPVNIGGLSETLIDDELFGHCKGAFTGAANERAGMIEQAENGTLFLDEIGELHLPLQVKLLRLIQEGQYQTIGCDRAQYMNARIVVATNKKLEDLAREGVFRKDLFYRLSTHRVHLPPLRDRKEDIPYLIEKFLEESARELGKKIPTPPHELYSLLASYHFPGNVRELRGMIFDAVSRHTSGTLSMKSFWERIHPGIDGNTDEPFEQSRTGAKVAFCSPLPTLKEVQELLIQEALKVADGNQTIAAGILGMSRRALNNRLCAR